MKQNKWCFLVSRDGDRSDRKRTDVRLKITPYLKIEPVLMASLYLETASYKVFVTPEAKTMLGQQNEAWAKAQILDHCIGWQENFASDNQE